MNDDQQSAVARQWDLALTLTGSRGLSVTDLGGNTPAKARQIQHDLNRLKHSGFAVRKVDDTARTPLYFLEPITRKPGALLDAEETTAVTLAIQSAGDSEVARKAKAAWTKLHSAVTNGLEKHSDSPPVVQLCASCNTLLHFGRQQDQHSQVFAFEANREFRFSPANCLPKGSPLSLAEIPVVRLRGKIPAGPVTFKPAVEAVQKQLRDPEIFIDTKSRTLSADGITCRLPHAEMAIYGWMAKRRKAELPHITAPPKDRPSQEYAIELLQLYQAVRGPMGCSDRTENRLQGGLTKDHFFEWRSKANRDIEAAWGPQAGHYLIETLGKRPNSRYGLNLPPSAIHFV